MEEHHSAAIETFVSLYRPKEEFVALVLAGSLAHGFAQANSDVDILLVATPEEYEKRRLGGQLAFSLWDICRYPGGYIDCKVVSLPTMETIAHKGSDPARYAWKDARILWSGHRELPEVLARITRYPREKTDERRHRFACQLLAWKWYLSQAEEKNNPYLLHLSAQKVTLFSCRLILNANDQLYPYHKWLLEETRRSPRKPPEFLSLLDAFLARPSFPLAQSIADSVLAFLGLTEKGLNWPGQFLDDSELNWVDHEAPVDDL